MADDLVRGELLSGQVQFQSVAEAVPPVVVDPLAVAVNLSSHEIATEEVVEDESRGAALATSGIAWVPVGNVFRRAGVSAHEARTARSTSVKDLRIMRRSFPEATDIESLA
ncbi:hypothetical protein R4I43_19050 [Saccharopolyspora sp. S2-29]|uniref:Uncharacterized protein n=1 Tax=Saccharopolyspora mangrovi TaxID=3082379 RepID=A0ABU6ADB9_9PSEU|nr:hypothetical protein [Saccharopolyspora sp. S2-29]MEB3369514.1 hypothetical protein [Saccharopolyspora sp. S2-29]